MLYTRKGDRGTTKVLDSKERMPKSSALSEALGTLDELNSFLGLCKIAVKGAALEVDGKALADITHDLQRDLFIVQAELAGSDKQISEAKVKEIEMLIDTMEAKMPPITSFFISGGTPSELNKSSRGVAEAAARFDVARTLARRAERTALRAAGSGERDLSEHTRAYLNRLSSILYALARFSNHISGIKEESPDYR